MFRGPYELSGQNLREVSSSQSVKLGTKGETIDGRIFRYSKAGAVALVAGKVHVAAAHVANHVNQAVQAAAAVGDTRVSLTLGATAATANQYAGGLLVMNDAAGEGIAYRISSHDAAASAGVLGVNLEEPVAVALTTSSEYSLIANPWNSVIISPSAIAHRPVGVANVAVAISNFTWLQTGGDAATLADGVISKGAGAILSDAVDGALEIEVAATVVKRVGYAPEATVDTEHRLITLTLD